MTENYADDSSDDEVERSETKIDDRRVGDKEVELRTTTAADLNAINLEQHNKNMEEGGDTHEFNNHRNSSSDECDSETKTQVGAGLFFGLSGLLIGGPIFGVLTGTGAAIVASKDKGVAGDVARGMTINLDSESVP